MAPFPPLVIFALGALGAAFVVRHVVKQWTRGKVDANQPKGAAVEPPMRDSLPKLRRDPDTGVYRP